MTKLSWNWKVLFFFDAIEVPRNLFFCCWESLPRNVSQSLEGMSDLNLTLEARPLGY